MKTEFVKQLDGRRDCVDKLSSSFWYSRFCRELAATIWYSPEWYKLEE